MSDRYDGVVIGAGHHGLILAAYLARAGLDILLVERRPQYGGGLMTEECTLPGFHHNLHSVNHFNVTASPWFADLGLADRVQYITPRYEFAQPHRDGTALVFSRDRDELLANIARFSPRDAKTFREWNARAEGLTSRVFMVERFSEPLPRAEREEILGASEIGRDFLALTRRQPQELVEELFESERVKVLFLFKLSLFGTVLHEALVDDSPLGSVLRAFDLRSGYEICRGGSWNLARGLMETLIAAGGKFRARAHVQRIVVEGGRATGIELADGRSIQAGFVASTLDVHQTFAELVGEEQLPSEFALKVRRFKHARWTLFGLHLALRDRPRYASAGFDANVDRALKYNIGSETVADLLLAHEEVENKQVPSTTQFGGGALSVLDPTLAPAGAHTAYAWHVVPFDPGGDPEALRDIGEEMAPRIMETWRRYAPNMTTDNVLGSYTYSAYDYSRELINMRHGDIMMGQLGADQVLYNHFGYRTPVGGLYMAGSPTHPNGSISGGAGYIAAGLIARDLGVRPWWTPQSTDALRRLGPAA